jgi:hypothetical protein
VSFRAAGRQFVSTAAPATAAGRPGWLHGFLRRRLVDPARLRNGVVWLTSVAIAYAAVIVMLAAGGDQPGDLPPWLNIAAADYFWWEAVFIAPVILASGVLAAACMYLLARATGGTGSFDDTLALVGPAVALCTLFTLIPDLTIAVLLDAGVIDAATWLHNITQTSLALAFVWTYLALYAAAFLTVFPMVVTAVHRVRIVPAIAVGWAGFAIYEGVLIIFVR